MMKYNIKVPLAVIPAGTSNDFAFHLGLYGDIDKAVQKIIDGNIEDVDIGKVNGSYFVNILSAGMFSIIVNNSFFKLATLLLNTWITSW